MTTEIVNSKIESTCFFCGTHQSQDEPMKVDIYKVTKRKETYVVFANKISLNYKAMTIEIPRCSDCKNKHDRFALLLVVPAGGILLAAAVFAGIQVWQWWQAAAKFEFSVFAGRCVQIFFGTCLGFIAVYWIHAIVEFFADCFGFNTERRSRRFEPLATRLCHGWEIGDKNYGEKIRFIITFNPETLINLFTRKWF